MSTEANKSVVKRFFDELCNARRLEIAGELFSSDHTYTDPGIPGVPSGPEGQKQLIGAYQTAFPDARWHVDETIAVDDKVVTRWRGTGTHKATLAGNPAIPATGKAVSVTGVWIHRIADGKIQKSWNVWDMLGLLQQLGVVPGPQR